MSSVLVSSVSVYQGCNLWVRSLEWTPRSLKITKKERSPCPSWTHWLLTDYIPKWLSIQSWTMLFLLWPAGTNIFLRCSTFPPFVQFSLVAPKTDYYDTSMGTPMGSILYCLDAAMHTVFLLFSRPLLFSILCQPHLPQPRFCRHGARHRSIRGSASTVGRRR